MLDQFFIGCPTHEIEAKHLKGALCGLAAGPKSYKQTCYKCTIDLDGNTVFRLCKEVTAAQDTFEPAEEKLYLPPVTPVTIDKGDDLCRQV